MRFGKDEVTRVIDQKGSTVTTVTNYHKGVAVNPIRHRYEIRERIIDLDASIKLAADFIEEATCPETKKKDMAIRIDNSHAKEGGYDLVQCYTILEY